MTNSFEQGCGGFIIQVKKSCARFLIERLVAAKKKSVCCRYNNQKYIFLPNQYEDVNLDLVNLPYMYFFPNIAFISLLLNNESGNHFSIYGSTYFNNYKYKILKVTSEILDYWSFRDGFKYGTNLFPDRIKNVMGYKFFFASLNYSPFSLIINENNKTVFDGFETRIAGLFVEIINGTWDGLSHDTWGEVLPNGTGTGILRSIMGLHLKFFEIFFFFVSNLRRLFFSLSDRKAEFGYSGIYQWFCTDVDCSFPYYQSGVTCLVPRPELVSEWLTIVLPFRLNTWIALVFVYILNTIFFLFSLSAWNCLTGETIIFEIYINKRIKLSISSFIH